MIRTTLRAGICLAMLAAAIPAHAQDEATEETVIATVDGQSITLGDVISVLSELPPQVQSLPPEMLFDGIRQQLVDSLLVSRAAEAAGIGEDPDFLRQMERQRTALLADAFILRTLEQEVTEDALRARYAAEYADAEPEIEIRASHILVPTEDAAQALRDQLDAGADFAELAAEHGTDGTRMRGGDLGFFTRDMMVPEFAEAAFALEPGETAGPVQTQFGWHVLRVTEAREVPVPSFEEVRDELADTMNREVVAAMIDALREGAEVSLEDGRPGLDVIGRGGFID